MVRLHSLADCIKQHLWLLRNNCKVAKVDLELSISSKLLHHCFKHACNLTNRREKDCKQETQELGPETHLNAKQENQSEVTENSIGRSKV